MKVKSLSRVQLLATHGLQPTRLLHPWDFPGKSTGVGCHCLLRFPLHSPAKNFSLLQTLTFSLFDFTVHWAQEQLLLQPLTTNPILPTSHVLMCTYLCEFGLEWRLAQSGYFSIPTVLLQLIQLEHGESFCRSLVFAL